MPSRVLSVRKTAAVEAALAEILELSTAETATEVVHRALDLYRAWLRTSPGTTVAVTGHTRRRT
jgi:hypothetical protein